MYIREVQIRNFKNFHKSRFLFNRGVNVILGENDSGKSNFFHAIRVVLDKRLNWNEKELSEKTFSRALSDWRGEMIIISIRFADLDTNKEEQAVLINATGTENRNEGSITNFFLPKRYVRKKMAECQTFDDFFEYKNSITLNDYETIITFGSSKDYLDDEIYKQLTFDYENEVVNYSELLDDALFGYRSNSTITIDSIRNDLIDFTYIDALRNTVYELKQKNNPLMTMLRQLETKICDSEKQQVQGLINKLNDSIGNIQSIKQLETKIYSKILDSVGLTYSQSIKLSSEISTEISDAFRNLKLKTNTVNGDEYELNDSGLGTTNIIYIALKLLEYSYIREIEGNDSKYFLLLFEEPEAHLHKHIQMSLFEKAGFNLASSEVQVILSTHSDNISAASKISSMNVIDKKENFSLVMQPWIGLEPNQIIKVERYLDSKRSHLLFSKSVILVEGDAEEILIPNMIKKVFGLSLDELGISLINIGSVGFENISILFSENRIQRKCAIITDIDKPIDEENKKQKRAYILGLFRRKKLLDIKNKYIQPFFNDYTFEIELFKGNKEYFIKLIDISYSEKLKREELKKLIKSDNIKEHGGAILKLAKKNKKGWNAILLSEIIDGKFLIPEYLLEVLIYCSNRKIFQVHNIKTMLSHYYLVYEGIEIDILNDEELQERIKEVISNNNSSISKLLEKMD